jgi:hypothetical protein
MTAIISRRGTAFFERPLEAQLRPGKISCSWNDRANGRVACGGKSPIRSIAGDRRSPALGRESA